MIKFENGEIAKVTLKNPERHNALTHEDFSDLTKILDEIERSQPRVLILTGDGQSFCSGVEFQALQSGDWAHENPLNKLCNRIEKLAMPTIAAINGHFVGGGAELAFACDFRIAVSKAKCKIPAATIAVHYEPTGIDRIIRIVGKQITRRLLLAHETFEGPDLIKFQFVDSFSDTPYHEAHHLATRIVHLAPKALEGMKLSLAGDNETARARIEAAFASSDFAEAMKAITEKRPPVFTGK